MITLLNPLAETMIPVQAGEALKQGMWVTETGYNATSGEVEVEKVDSDGIAKYDRDKIFLVLSYPIDIAGDEDTYETIAHDAMCIRTGNYAGLQVEDDALVANSTTTNWGLTAFGADLVLNTNGFLTEDGKADAGSSRTIIAKFLRCVNDIVFYQTVVA